MSFDPLSDLTKERSFWDLRRLALGLRSPRAATYCRVALVVGLAAGVCSVLSTEDVGELVRAASGTIFQFATTILGILIAGFAIFTTISGSEVASTLALTEHEDTGMSEMKRIALHFTRVFVRYIESISYCCGILLFGFKGGPCSTLAKVLTTAEFSGGRYMGGLIYGLLVALAASLIVELATFVFNVHVAFMIMVRGRIDPYSKYLSEQRQADLNEAARLRFKEAADTAVSQHASQTALEASTRAQPPATDHAEAR